MWNVCVVLLHALRPSRPCALPLYRPASIQTRMVALQPWHNPLVIALNLPYRLSIAKAHNGNQSG